MVSEAFGRLDIDRSARIGMPEAVLCEPKSVEQCVALVEELLKQSTDAVIATRVRDEQKSALSDLKPLYTGDSTLTWRHREPSGKTVAIATGGTSDLKVADECLATLAALGHQVGLFADVGVAGLHRLISVVDRLAEADVVVAIAGMEGSLPTVLGGLIGSPIIAVPTSTGYGSSEGGRAALSSMLASCSSGLAVVGIDNGFGAACAAHRVVSRCGGGQSKK